MELHKKYPDDVACVSLSLDVFEGTTADNEKGPVLKFLREKQATFDNILASAEEYTMYEKFKFPDGVIKPVVLVYDKDGTLAKRFDNAKLGKGQEKEFTYEKDVAPYVAELVKK